MQADRQTDIHTYTLIAILRPLLEAPPTGSEVNMRSSDWN